MIKLLNRTHFRKSRVKDQGWQWFWSMEAPNGNVISVGGEGYHHLRDALNGFFSAQGYPEWTPTAGGLSLKMPQGYRFQRYDPQHYVVTQHTEDTQESDN